MAKSFSHLCVVNFCMHINLCYFVNDKFFFEKGIMMSNHCGNLKFIFMLDKSGVGQGEDSS